MGAMKKPAAKIKSYKKGGMVYSAEMGNPPMEPDMMTSLKPAQRKAAEARMKEQKAAPKVTKKK